VKKIASGIILVFCFVGLITADGWKDVKKFQEYKMARAIAIEADSVGNTVIAVSKYLEAADIAKSSDMKLIEAWQRNNAAYSLIKRFKIIKQKVLLEEAMKYLTDAETTANTLSNNELTLKIKSNIEFCRSKL
jgi:hypothetical protein